MECLSYCVANQINLARLEQQLASNLGLKTTRYWNVVEFERIDQHQYAYIFQNGTIVTWNIKRHEMQTYIELILPVCDGLIDKPYFDGFTYQIGDKIQIQPHEHFNIECITLDSDEKEIKLSLSYAFSQSIKLKCYEHRLENLIVQYHPLIKKLSTSGKINLSREQIRRIIGRVLSEKSELNLVSDFIYQPKFFWQYPNYEHYYVTLKDYLDIQPRTNTLNQQLNTLNEMFMMLNSYLENRHSHALEIIIIALIAIEIIFGLLNLHF